MYGALISLMGILGLTEECPWGPGGLGRSPQPRNPCVLSRAHLGLQEQGLPLPLHWKPPHVLQQGPSAWETVGEDTPQAQL